MIFLVGLVVVLLVTVGAFYLWFQQKEKVLADTTVKQNDTVTLFVPGDHGNETSFGGMIKRLDKYHLGNFSYTVKIHKDKTFTEIKRKGFKDNGMVQLVFDDNTNPPAENKQLYVYMQHLKKVGVKAVNLVGHSSGGPMSTEFMMSYSGDSTIPPIKKFVSISGDFQIPLEGDYIADGKKLPKDLKALNIGGKIWGFDSDGMVPLEQVTVMKDIFEGNVASYKYVEIDGSPLSTFHFMLHENPEIDKLVAEFLWE